MAFPSRDEIAAEAARAKALKAKEQKMRELRERTAVEDNARAEAEYAAKAAEAAKRPRYVPDRAKWSERTVSYNPKLLPGYEG